MSGSAWLAGAFAALMIATAVYCAGRLAAWRLRGRDTELDTDGLHVLMGVAMAGMFEPQLSVLPGTAWRAVFTVAGAWFAWQAIRPGGRGRGAWCAYPVPHAVECAAMVYMLLFVGSQPAGREATAMPGMIGGAAGSPAITLLLALFMLGYVVWTIDRLATLSLARAAVTAPGTAMGNGSSAAATVPVAATIPGTPRPGGTGYAGTPDRPALVPRPAICCKIAMGIAMGYMLAMML
jgi:hypothetical protein